MKRHPSLIPLSKFHRSILFLALIARENAPAVKGYPAKLEDRIAFALTFYSEKLLPHFNLEAEIWEYVQSRHPILQPLIAELQSERKDILLRFKALSGKRSATEFFALGPALEKHVRKEERQLFQQIQSHATVSDYDWIENHLNKFYQ